MMHPVSRNMARLMRRIRRRDMKIGKLKRELRKLRRRQRKMEEERKAVITVAENGGIDKNIIDVSIAVFPGATSVGKCGDLAWIGFRAIKEELAKMPVNINDGVGKII